MADILFVTGADTGAGKTVLTALLTRHLRQRQIRALAMKPFCSGGADDVRLLWNAQERAITLEETTPFLFQAPLAPLAAARMEGRTVRLDEVVRRVRSLAARCEVLLVEGAGGLFAPLGPGYTAADLIRRLRCAVLIAAPNRLGTVNHTLLTLGALEQMRARTAAVILVGQRRPDESAATNARLITEFSRARVIALPYLGRHPITARALERNVKKVEKTLAQISEASSFSTAFRNAGRKNEVKKFTCTAERKS